MEPITSHPLNSLMDLANVTVNLKPLQEPNPTDAKTISAKKRVLGDELHPLYKDLKLKHFQRQRRGLEKVINGVAYTGLWNSDNLIKGMMTMPGRTYRGEFKDLQPHGKGMMETIEGFIFEGEWSHGILEGPIKVYSKKGEFTGNWKDNKWVENKAKITFKNGDTYEGSFSDKGDIESLLPEGKGILTTSKNIYDGLWKGRNFVQGKITYKNHKEFLEYNGSVLSDKFHGHGVLLFKDGRKVEGSFLNGHYDHFGCKMTQGDKLVLFFHDEEQKIAELYEVKKRLPHTHTMVTEQQTSKKARTRKAPAAAEIPPIPKMRTPVLPPIDALCKQMGVPHNAPVPNNAPLLNGFQKMIINDRTYTGSWTNGRLFNGACEINATDLYEGSFDINLRFTGRGTLDTPTYSYEGFFADDRPEGLGKLTYKNNPSLKNLSMTQAPSFIGFFRAGKPCNGRGLLEIGHGRFSFGEFVNGALFSGVGFVRNEQHVFAGIVMNGVRMTGWTHFLGYPGQIENWQPIPSSEQLFVFFKQHIILQQAMWKKG